MSHEFVSATPRDCDAAVSLLLKSFRMSAGAPFVEPALLEWKYFRTRPDWSGGRSYLLKKENRPVAHAGAFPVTFLTPGGPVRANHMIDWAADGNEPGAGLLVCRRLSELTPVMLTMGGSQDTRAILPRMRYRRAQTFDIYARPVQPWKQFRTDPYRRGWKQPLRILRNAGRHLAPVAGKCGWSCRKITAFDHSIVPLLESPATLPFVRVARSPELLNYFLACPAGQFSAYHLLLSGEIRGWFVLGRVAHQTRIADIWVGSSDPIAWRAAYSVATAAAAADPECCEVVAGASTDLARQAITANGFVHDEAEPLFLYDPQHLLDGLILQMELMDGDAAFHTDLAYPYRT